MTLEAIKLELIDDATGDNLVCGIDIDNDILFSAFVDCELSMLRRFKLVFVSIYFPAHRGGVVSVFLTAKVNEERREDDVLTENVFGSAIVDAYTDDFRNFVGSVTPALDDEFKVLLLRLELADKLSCNIDVEKFDNFIGMQLIDVWRL